MAFSIVDFAKNLFKITVALCTFFLFGYVELEYKCGSVVCALVGLYLFWSGTKVLPTLLVLGNVAASYFAVKPVVVLTFLGLLCMIFFVKFETKDDTKVVLRPYESEVRNILFRHDPSLLHTVDTMLDEHRGREKELIYKLVTQYEGATGKATNQAKSPSPKTPKQQLQHSYPAQSEREDAQSTVAEAGSSKSATTNGHSIKSESVKSEVGSPTSSWSSYTTTVLKIKNILRRCDPALYASVDRMLADYVGHEGDLLREIQEEFGEDGNGNANGRAEGSGGTGGGTPHGASASGSVHYEEYDRGISVATGGSCFTSPNSAYAPGYTPADVYSVASEFPSQAQRRDPFSPTRGDRFNAAQGGGGHYIFGDSQDSTDTTYGRYAPAPLQASPVGAPVHVQRQQDQQGQQGQQGQQSTYAAASRQPYSTSAGTRAHANTNAGAYSGASSSGAGSYPSHAAQIKSAVALAQEDARREMQARIDARWGPKPASTGAATGPSGVQKRHGYPYPG